MAFRSDKVTVTLVFDRVINSGKGVRFRRPGEEFEFFILPVSEIEMEDDPIRGEEIDVVVSKWLAEKEDLI